MAYLAPGRPSLSKDFPIQFSNLIDMSACEEGQHFFAEHRTKGLRWLWQNCPEGSWLLWFLCLGRGADIDHIPTAVLECANEGLIQSPDYGWAIHWRFIRHEEQVANDIRAKLSFEDACNLHRVLLEGHGYTLAANYFGEDLNG